ncbi:hypothetical protein AAKU61_000223 [Undibacterium sp. GrIS 1.2]
MLVFWLANRDSKKNLKKLKESRKKGRTICGLVRSDRGMQNTTVINVALFFL